MGVIVVIVDVVVAVVPVVDDVVESGFVGKVKGLLGIG